MERGERVAKSTDRVKGITISIGGETTGLSKALSSVNKNIGETQKQLNDVNKLLKLDPKNTVLLAQKQKLLADATEDTAKKLKTLESAQQQLQNAVKIGDITQEQYDAYQREIEETRSRLNKLNQETENTNKSMSKVTQAVESAKKGLKNVSSVAKTAAAGIAAVATAAVALVEGTQEVRSDLSKLEINAANAGVGLNTIEEAMRKLNFITGETDSNVEALSNLLAAEFDDSTLPVVLENLAGAVIRFPDTLKIESLADSLQETIATGKSTGQFAELLDRLGISAEKFDERLSKTNNTLQRQNLVLETLSKSGLANVTAQYEQANESQKEYSDAQYNLNQVLYDLAQQIAPIVAKAVSGITSVLVENADTIENVINTVAYLVQMAIAFIGVLSKIPAPVYMIIGTIVLVIKAINTAKKAVDSVTGGINSIKTAMDPANASMMKMVLVVSLLIGGLTLLALLILAITQGVDNARKAIDSFNNVKIPSVESAEISNMPKYASGTKSARRGWALVGENGPELMLMRGGETIIPNNRLAYAGAGGDVYNITIDAKNVREFNDVVKIAQNARQYKRARG